MVSLSNVLITHVIFDFDGTLIAVLRFGPGAYPGEVREAIRPVHRGQAQREEEHRVVPHLRGRVGPGRSHHSRRLLRGTEGDADGALPFLPTLARSQALGRSSSCKWDTHVCGSNRTFAMMHHVVLGDDPELKERKPAADTFLVALKRFEDNVDSGKVLVFEDAPSGVAAAKSAGLSVVMIPDAALNASHCKEADQILSSLLDFNPSQWGLPPFEDMVI